MNKKNVENLILESYENEFSYKENKSNLNITFNRIAFIFFIFLMVCFIYSIKIFYLGSLKSKVLQEKKFFVKNNFRADIIDNSGNFIAKTVNTLIVGIRPNLIIDEKKLLINLQLIFPDKDFSHIKPNSYLLEIENFISNLKNKKKISPSAEDGLEIMKMIEFIYSK